jgi:2-polyprenyl-3-methyl-5-hydroxy-6-metoxy-1,4-benzoquinol methylase
VTTWDHSSHGEFYDYYSEASIARPTIDRFRLVRDSILRVMRSLDIRTDGLDVADIGCGAGTQSMMWAELGHRVHGLDINEPLLELAKKRFSDDGFTGDFQLGSATDLPWLSGSIDVCLAVELLEHVNDWEACLREFVRVIRPGGVLFLSTTNVLCPVQHEFNLPAYSWYPRPIKHYIERLAMTRRPDLANFAKYPAVNWFTFFQLRDYLGYQNFECLDRFDMMDNSRKPYWMKSLIAIVRRLPICRAAGHIMLSDMMMLAIKKDLTATTSD